MDALRSRLSVAARVNRDNEWVTVPAANVVAGDVVRVRAGDFVPADLRVVDGALTVDQSALTGESLPVEVGAGATANSGSIVGHGEATGVVTATGPRTAFGKTAELVDQAAPPTHLETIVLSVVRYLLVLDIGLILVVLVATPLIGVGWCDALPFALVLLIASVPVALPATFTLAQAIGSRQLARAGGDGHGVLVTRLSSIQEAASMDVLCTDKTGTLTRNELTVDDTCAYPPTTPDQLLSLAASGSDPAGRDAIDLALLAAAPAHSSAVRLSFAPFDPATKRTEATVADSGRHRRIVKGAPAVLEALTPTPPATLAIDVDRLAARGARVIAVAVAEGGDPLSIVGLVALADPPRPDSAELISELHRLGIEVKMVTGDSLPTARAVAGAVGLGTRIAPREALLNNPASAADHDGFAGVFPEDKYQLVRALQHAGHVVGMTGDGVNDAPALRQAEVGVAVASATDVARAAASMVLTDPGLVNVIAAVQESRRVYRRMTTWTLNKIIKTVQVTTFLTGSLLWTRSFVMTPTLMVMLLFANDFVTMALGTDRVQPAPLPRRWRVRPLVAAAGTLGLVTVAESFLVLALCRGPLHLAPAEVNTAVFTHLVFSGLATVYVVREHNWFWSSAPSRALTVATVADVIAVTTIGRLGLGVTPISLPVIALIAGVALAFMFLLTAVQKIVLRRFRLA